MGMSKVQWEASWLRQRQSLPDREAEDEWRPPGRKPCTLRESLEVAGACLRAKNIDWLSAELFIERMKPVYEKSAKENSMNT